MQVFIYIPKQLSDGNIIGNVTTTNDACTFNGDTTTACSSIIGYCSTAKNQTPKQNYNNYVTLTKHDDQFAVDSLKINGQMYALHDADVTCIVLDCISKGLLENIEKNRTSKPSVYSEIFHVKLQAMAKYSYLVEHLFERVTTTNVALHIPLDKSRETIIKNILINIISDTLIGLLFALVVCESSQMMTGFDVFYYFDTLIGNFRTLTQYLMGSPAGLKLNHAFNSMLGNFFLYHITLWNTFLSFVNNVTGAWMLRALYWFSLCGFSFAIACVMDVVSLLTLHSFCIYIYAARFYQFQINGLVSLWRFFLGRKYNPLRNRIDSCEYSSRQLFIGTLSFTILLFLLPTTLLYYTVFTALRLILLLVQTVLWRVKRRVANLSIYVIILWMFASKNFADRAVISRTYVQCDTVRFVEMRAQFDSLSLTIARYSLDRAKTNADESTLRKVIFGQLVAARFS